MTAAFRFPFHPHAFGAAVWVPEGCEGLGLGAHYIAGPRKGEDRGAWLRALHAYRRCMRDGSGNATVRLGPRAGTWMLASPDLSAAYDARPGETLRLRLEGRLVDGAGEVSVGFNKFHRRERTWADWPLQGGVACRVDSAGNWQELSGEVTVPDFDPERLMVYPMIGCGSGTVEIRRFEMFVDDPARMAAVDAVFAGIPQSRALDLRAYDRDDLKWAAAIFSSHMTFMYDEAFYDSHAGGFRLDEFLDEGEREFGGYQAILLWHAYPRIGVDERNQFDFYRDMPGGLKGLRDLCRRAHARGVKLLINYNPWDTGTRREAVTDEESLAVLLAEIEADGIFLDTMGGGSPTLRRQVDACRPGVVFEPEGHPDDHQLAICNSSWAQRLEDPEPPGLLRLKWIEPRHMQRQIRRWDKSHRTEIESAFFNGAGMLLWENVFGTVNLWRDEDRALWRRTSGILRHFAALFLGDGCDPFYPTLAEGLFANRWPDDGMELFTILNDGEPLADAPLLEVPSGDDTEFIDLWSGRQLGAEVRDGATAVIGSVERITAVLAIRKGRVDQPLLDLMARQRAAAAAPTTATVRNRVLSVVEPLPVAPTPPAAAAPPGMVRVDAATFTMRIEHEARECNCYPDPGTPPDRWREFLERSVSGSRITHEIGPLEIAPFWIDEAQVTNREYLRFLGDSGYAPRHPENFLRHWTGGTMPDALAEHPVVYVDLEDARAYARWAGKRLPTEPEWQLAAQGAAGLKWPWGGEFDPARCNSVGAGTMPVRSLPEGRSPCGCYHMSGNAWEWTESERSDGHTRFAMIRGGSWFKAEGSVMVHARKADAVRPPREVHPDVARPRPLRHRRLPVRLRRRIARGSCASPRCPEALPHDAPQAAFPVTGRIG